VLLLRPGEVMDYCEHYCCPVKSQVKKKREPNAKGRRDKIRTGPALCVILLVHFFPGCFLLRWLNTAFHFEFALFKIR